MIRVAAEPATAEPVVALLAEAKRELLAIYGGADTEPGGAPAPESLDVVLVARDRDGAILGCGALRRIAPDAFELKRMYVRRAARGRGAGRAILAALEDEARTRGAARVALETGPRQVAAMGLYESAGYARIPAFGIYVGEPLSRCYGREL